MPERTDTLTISFLFDEILSPLDSFASLLITGGHEDVADVALVLIRETHARLQSVARCLESGCGRQLAVRSLGGALAPVPCHCRSCPRENPAE